MRRKSALLVVLVVLACACQLGPGDSTSLAAAPSVAAPPAWSPGQPDGLDYTFQFWPLGWRGATPENTHLLAFQTGRFGLVLEVERLRLRHFGPLRGSKTYAEAASESTDRLMALPPATLDLVVEQGAHRYRAVRAGFPSRMIEHGRFFQRCDIQQIVLEDERGTKLSADARLEIGAWPDRLSLLLEVTAKQDLADGAPRIELRTADRGGAGCSTVGIGPWKAGETQRAWLHWTPKDVPSSADEAIEVTAVPLAASRAPTSAAVVALKPLEVRYDPVLDWRYIPVPTQPWSLADEPDRLERVRVKVRNKLNRPQVARLVFGKEESFEGVTGMSPMLRGVDGVPTGIPVQISKNWHQRPQRLLYDGPWFHGITLLRLEAGQCVEYEFSLAYARWGGVAAASHAQLCLVGWGVDQLWDQSAIGSWGESFCYDPDVCLNRSMIDDVRPLMVWAIEQQRGKWTWTNNVGGGDFLVYHGPDGQRQYLARMRTAYLAQCPNLTRVVYAGRTPDGAIAVRMEVSMPRADDYARAMHRFRYDVLAPVRPKRLGLYQLGADHYNGATVRRAVFGNATGVVSSWTPGPDLRKDEGYVGSARVCKGRLPWVALQHAERRDPKGGALANRGMIVRSWRARVAGRDVAAPFVALYRTPREGGNVIAELQLPPDVEQLAPGDFVEGCVESVVMPIAADDYYGPNAGLRAALALAEAQTQTRDDDAWKMIHREAVGNDLAVGCTVGAVRADYPVEIAADASGRAEFRIRGGVGYVPITIHGVSSHRGGRLLRREGGVWKPVDQSVHGNDFWQTDFDAARQAWRITYNVPLDQQPAGNAAGQPEPVDFRFEPR